MLLNKQKRSWASNSFFWYLYSQMKEFFLLIYLLGALKLQAQNLVLNPSFEDTIPCAINPGPPAMEFAVWFWPTNGSPDYYSELFANCNINAPMAPQSYVGYQYARSGVAYASFSTYIPPGTGPLNYREYIEGVFSDTLVAGHQYSVSFFISAADSCKYYTDAIGAYLSVDSLTNYPSLTTLNTVTPQIENVSGNVIYDTLNWILISGIYNASGGEKYITIGNFKDNSNTTLDSLINGLPGACYFIDDVSVVDCTTGIHEIDNEKYNVSLTPNPAKEYTSYRATLNKNKTGEVKMFSMQGIQLLNFKLSGGENKRVIDLQKLLPGIYILETFEKEKIIDRHKLVVIK